MKWLTIHFIHFLQGLFGTIKLPFCRDFPDFSELVMKLSCWARGCFGNVVTVPKDPLSEVLRVATGWSSLFAVASWMA